MNSLLVEDNPADARLIREMLRDSHAETFELQQVARLDSALQRLRQESFDVVLLDLGLPDSQGIKTLTLTQRIDQHLPIVVLTGLDDESCALEAMRAGAQDYLVKGNFDSELLVRTIRYAIERKRAEEEVRRLNAELERRVAERTAQLQASNDELVKEVAERKRAEQALQEAQAIVRAHAEDLERTVASRTSKLQEMIAELEHFSYAIVHDLRAPLRAMQGFADLLEEECGGCGRALSKEYFRRIKIASSRMDQLIADCLSYSQAARQELKIEPVDLFQLVDGLVQTYPNLQPDNADIEIDPALPAVLGNQAALTQCFSNLLDNAVKFAKPGTKPRIQIRADLNPQVQTPPAEPRPEHNQSPPPAGRSPLVRIWVEDNGIGIHQNAQHRIFGIFQRATSQRQGTGIGLAIVRKVVEQMGGRVGVESEEGQGSRFWVELRRA